MSDPKSSRQASTLLPSARGSSYQDSGVDIAAGEEAVERIKDAVAATFRDGVLGGIGGFGGMFAFPEGKYGKAVLVSSTDGVGTKSYVATALGSYSTIGTDLVAMCVDDLVCTGAEPLFMLDYLAMERLDPGVAEQIVSGVAAGCRKAGCALIGGEMAEHPPEGSDPRPGFFDLAGFAVGVVDEARILRPESVKAGDALVGVVSPGLRCNGYSLARNVLLSSSGRSLQEAAYPGSDLSLGEELLRPSIVYAPDILALAEAVELHALAHVTGGGIAGNVSRVLPAGLGAKVETGSWPVPRIFEEIRRCGDVADQEMYRVFNMGIGMVAVVAAAQARPSIELLGSRGLESWEVGRVVEGHDGVEVVGL